MLTTSQITVIKPIRNQKDWNQAHDRLGYLLSPEVKAYEKPEGDALRDEFDVLSDLMYAYEYQKDSEEDYNRTAERFDPIEWVKNYMEDAGVNQNELAKRLDMSVSRLSEFLNRKSRMNWGLAVKLYKIVGVPAEALLEYSDDAAVADAVE